MKARPIILLTAVAFTLLSACAKQQGAREIDWAKAALSRNPGYEILATDEHAGLFTVRDLSTGEVKTLRVAELVAAPPSPAIVVAAVQETKLAQELAESPAPAAEPATLASHQTTAPTADARGGAQLAEGPGYNIERGTTAQNAATTFEGPGYSITRQEPGKRPKAAAPEAVASNVERRTDPIICQGERLMRIDGETIEFTGDAVIAEKGCDLYISNANIRAGGVGIIARQARVHIVNSTINGTRGSYEASQGAEIYVASSTFSGVGRRFDTATMNDLGGNDYQSH